MQAALSSDPRADTPLSWLQSPPDVPGLIRAEPADFVVDEQIAVEPEGTGEHAYLHIRKTGANTRWVAWQLSEFAGVREGDVGYAGRKDRHSVSTQWFSCYLPGQQDPAWDTMNIEGVELLTQTRHRQKLRPGDLTSNRFRIRVRTPVMTGADRTVIDERLQAVSAAGFPNYFGEQRFGRDAANLEAADRLLRLRERIRGDRGMVISAARSALFNQFLSNQVAAGASLAGDGPLYGRSRDPQPGEADLDEAGRAWVEGLRRLKAKADERALLAMPQSLYWTWEDTDTESESILVRFELPPGTYATALLREVFIIEDASERNNLEY